MAYELIHTCITHPSKIQDRTLCTTQMITLQGQPLGYRSSLPTCSRLRSGNPWTSYISEINRSSMCIREVIPPNRSNVGASQVPYILCSHIVILVRHSELLVNILSTCRCRCRYSGSSTLMGLCVTCITRCCLKSAGFPNHITSQGGLIQS